MKPAIVRSGETSFMCVCRQDCLNGQQILLDPALSLNPRCKETEAVFETSYCMFGCGQTA
jgi:hypothetical protein